jgi:hypothetical protein
VGERDRALLRVIKRKLTIDHPTPVEIARHNLERDQISDLWGTISRHQRALNLERESRAS